MFLELLKRKPNPKPTPPNAKITYKRATLKWPSHSTWRKSLSGSPFEKPIADHDRFFARGLTIGLLPFENGNLDSGPFFEKRIGRSRSVFRKRDLKADFHFRMGVTLLLARVRKTDRDPRSVFRKRDLESDFPFSNGRPKNSKKHHIAKEARSRSDRDCSQDAFEPPKKLPKATWSLSTGFGPLRLSKSFKILMFGWGVLFPDFGEGLARPKA